MNQVLCFSRRVVTCQLYFRIWGWVNSTKKNENKKIKIKKMKIKIKKLKKIHNHLHLYIFNLPWFI